MRALWAGGLSFRIDIDEWQKMEPYPSGDGTIKVKLNINCCLRPPTLP